MPGDNIISRTDAEALIPEDVSQAFLKGLDSESEVLSRFTRVPVGRKQTRFPVLSALPVAYFVNGDTGMKQTSEVNWDNKYLDIEEIAVIVPIPENVLDDTGVPIWSQVRPLMEQSAGRLLDAAVFYGANAPAVWPDDVVTSAIAAGNHDTVSELAAAGGIVADLNVVLSAVEADGYDPTYGVAHRSFRGLARQARNSQGDRFAEVNISKGIVEIDGVEYRFPMRGLWPTASGSALAIMYDPTEFVVGVRQDVTWKLLTEAVIQDPSTGEIIFNLAQQDMVALRMVLRVGWQVANTINYDQAVEASRYPAGVLRRA